MRPDPRQLAIDWDRREEAARWEVRLGDCIEVMRGMAGASVDAVVCDPPYGLSGEPDIAEVLRHWLAGDRYEYSGGGGFMGKTWDSFVPGPEYWRETYHVMKPGAHLVAFSGQRTYDLLVIALRLAGFEIRTMLGWVSGSSFPKSLDVSKAIDKAAGAEREIVGVTTTRRPRASVADAGITYGRRDDGGDESDFKPATAPATDAAKKWAGWGTAIKTSMEPIVLCRKPLAAGTRRIVLTPAVLASWESQRCGGV